VTARNTPTVDFPNPFPETYVQRVRSTPGVARADNLIVWYVTVALPSGSKEQVVCYGLEDFARWRFPWSVESGNVADLRRGRYVMLDDSAVRRFGTFQPGDRREFQGRRLKLIGRTREARSFTTSPIAFLDYQLAQSLAPGDLNLRTTFMIVKLKPGADTGAVLREIRRRLPYNDVYTKAEWAGICRRYWIESTGLGLTFFLTVFLGALVGVVIVAQTLHASTTEHLDEFGVVKALGGRNRDVYGMIAEQALFSAALGFAFGATLAHALEPLTVLLDLKLILPPGLYASVFVGAQVLCLGASTLSFRKVAALDPAMVFRG
jgi:putative ABC transport system permease protein